MVLSVSNVCSRVVRLIIDFKNVYHIFLNEKENKISGHGLKPCPDAEMGG